MNALQKLVYNLRYWLQKPTQVFVICLAVFLLSLFLNGTLWKIWSLQKDRTVIGQQILDSKAQIKHIEFQMKQAKDPYFIERQARDKMDMVSGDDLIFVFPDDQ